MINNSPNLPLNEAVDSEEGHISFQTKTAKKKVITF